jgi:hypothetical protein
MRGLAIRARTDSGTYLATIIRFRMDKENKSRMMIRLQTRKEREYLLGMLNRHAAEINEAFRSYHASIDRSGAVPQVQIRKRQNGEGKQIIKRLKLIYRQCDNSIG